MSKANTKLSLNTITIPAFQHPSQTEPTNTNKESTILVWFDPKNGSRYDAQMAKNLLHRVMSDITFYTEPRSCIAFIKSTQDKKNFLVTSGSYSSDLLSSVGNLPQIGCIFVFCMRQSKYEYLSVDYPKIVGIYIALDLLCASIKEQIDYVDHDLQAFSFIDPDKRITKDLSKELAEFLSLRLFNLVIRHQPRNEQTTEQMIDSCREHYQDNALEQKLIDQFEQNYQPVEAILWYLNQSFIYKIINNTFKTKDINRLYSLGLFIAHLSENLTREHKKILFNNQTMILYRGLKLSNSDLEKFKKNEGKLVSYNGFLSTTRDRSKALSFARNSMKRTDTNGTIVEIQCDVPQLRENVIFADIFSFSEAKDKNEILFDFSSVFQLESVRHDGDIWVIKMNATLEGQEITECYIRETRLDSEELSIAMILGTVIRDMGLYNQSQQYFEQMMGNSNDEDLALIEYQIGRALDLKGDWKAARKHYDQAYEQMMNKKSVNSDDPARVLNSIGNIVVYQEDYTEALDFFHRALALQEKCYPSGHVRTTVTLNSIGNILGYQSEYEEALKFHERALAIQEKHYPSDHVEVAATLTNMANILAYQDKNDKALEFHGRALEAKEKHYSSDHIEIANSLGGIATALRGQGKYDEALELYQRALTIQEYCYPAGHFDIANTLNGMATVLRAQEKYSEALELLQRALKIKEERYPSRHLDIAATLNNIGLILTDEGDYDRAIEYHERSLWMKEGLPVDNPSVGTSFGNLDIVYARKGDYQLALEYSLKFLANRQKFLPPNSPVIGDCLSSTGDTYDALHDSKMALKYYTQALIVYKKSLPVNHPTRQRTERVIQRVSEDKKCTLQ